MSKTVAPSPTDAALWRRLTARAHPDTGGDHELFIWAQHVRELVCEGGFEREHQPYATGPERDYASEVADRVPFEWYMPFEELTRRALQLADELPQGDPFREILYLLRDCFAATHGRLQLQERRGATYKQLALIAHRKGLTLEQRKAWYRVAEEIPLAQRQAGHIIQALQEDGR